MNVRCLALVGLFVLATSAGAQTDYYNTSSGRPLRVEDAVPLEYRGVELALAPLRFERSESRATRWSMSPQLALGVLPRTELHVELPIEYVDTRGTSARGLAGIEVSMLHALNAETSIPALAIGIDMTLPAGPLGDDASYASLKAVATRTLPWARFHLNGAVTLGPSVGASERDIDGIAAVDASRWWAGLAVDKTFPLRSLLISAEAYAEQSVANGADVEWNAGVGTRYQVTPRWALDSGVGRRLTGDDPEWYVTVGWAYALGIP
jgi:hypothetical protein